MARFKGQNKFIFKQFIQDFQYLYTQSISTKNYIYIIGVLCVSSVIKIEVWNMTVYLNWDDFRQDW